MPEIAEVARTVHFVRQHLVGKTIGLVKAQHDENVYGKVGTSGAEFEKALEGKKIVGVGQQGKYFWITMSSPPHPLMHFGMTGWLEFHNISTSYRRSKEPKGSSWPPKSWKFHLATTDKPPVEVAFLDSRRFARIRLIDCAGSEIRNFSPLKENGPDPVVDRAIVTEEWLVNMCKGRKVPIKALLLDQANISGIGNWVGDEVLYHAAVHPEQYAHTLLPAQLKKLHTCLIDVTSLAVEKLAESTEFPEDWLFLHRWGKGKKDAPKKLPNGDRIVFLTVGGRTSAVVPSRQKKTGAVAADVERKGEGEGEEEEEAGSEENGEEQAVREEVSGGKRATKGAAKVVIDAEGEPNANGGASGRGKASQNTQEEPTPKALKDETEAKPKSARSKSTPVSKKRKAGDGESKPEFSEDKRAKKEKKAVNTRIEEGGDEAGGRRRSGRLSGRG